MTSVDSSVLDEYFSVDRNICFHSVSKSCSAVEKVSSYVWAGGGQPNPQSVLIFFFSDPVLRVLLDRCWTDQTAAETMKNWGIFLLLGRKRDI